jgi:hypothetical protein
MLQSLFNLLKLMKNLPKSKMCWHAGWVKLDAVSEVFLRFEKITAVCELGGEMDAGAEVALVDGEALFEMVYRLLELFNSLILAPKVKVSLQNTLFI